MTALAAFVPASEHGDARSPRPDGLAHSFVTRPFYFGEGERLFGVLDLCEKSAGERSCVVLCQPLGHEYLWCHRACRALAARLAAAGHPVLRFDYRGCGDSLDTSEAADLERWTEDVREALGYARARFAGPCVVGLRLGATLAVLAQQDGAELEALLLWQPVVDGAAYLRELGALHAEHAARIGRALADRDGGDGRSREVLGFLYSDAAALALERLDLARLAPPRAARILQLVNADGEDQRRLQARLAAAGPPAELRHVPETSAWLSEPYKMTMPAGSISAAADWILRGAS